MATGFREERTRREEPRSQRQLRGSPHDCFFVLSGERKCGAPIRRISLLQITVVVAGK
jgi:hypothetical protein